MVSKQHRQQTGFACQECRRRKARCDRGLPSCGLCLEMGTVCVTMDRQAQRGPRKGQLSAMRSQIANLQAQLNRQVGGDADSNQSLISRQLTPAWDNAHDVDLVQGTADFDELSQAAVDSFLSYRSPPATLMLNQTPAAPALAAPSTPNLDWRGWMVDPERFDDPLLGMEFTKVQSQLMSPAKTASLKDFDFERPANETSSAAIDCDEQRAKSMSMTGQIGTTSPALMTEYERADLDHVFFDRVHPVLPLLCHRRCREWINQPFPGTTRACLRSAMRTIAAAMSAPATRYCDQLYAETRRLLEGYTATPKESIELEYIQVWLLLGFYELLRMDENQAMLTAARCSRLVLMARLFDIDAAPDSSSDEANGPQMSPATPIQGPHDKESFSIVEEKRRTFWLAYCLDCFLYSRNGYPPAIQEEMIYTQLPAPEANFQNNQPIRTPFLADVLTATATDSYSTRVQLSSFAECVVLATLYAQCSSYRRSRTTERLGTSSSDFWPRLKHLAAATNMRIKVLAANPTHNDGDPTLLFAHMLARGAIIKLSQAATSEPARALVEQQQQQQHKTRAVAAAAEIAWLTRQIPPFSCFKVHPFLPDPLACAIGFFNAERATSTATLPDAEDIAHLVRVLKDLQGMRSLAQEQSCKVF